MNIGLYQSAAALSSLERWQDAVAQNITSSQVPGYRARTVEVSGQASGDWQTDPNAQPGDAGTPAVFPKATNAINFKSGDTQPTGRDLDVAIQGQGFFEVKAPDGTLGYTRNGEFQVNSDRTLMNSAGAAVMSDSGNPITLSPAGGPVTIKADGSIVQGQTSIGRLGLMQFADPSTLTPEGGGMFANDTGTAPQPVAKPDLLQGYVEASNVTPMREMVDLVQVSRSYEANQKVIKTADQEAQKELDALG